MSYMISHGGEVTECVESSWRDVCAWFYAKVWMDTATIGRKTGTE